MTSSANNVSLAFFKKHKGLLGRTYTTAIVLRTFMSQVLRDGKDAAHYEDLAELFGFRWNTELDIRILKTHMNLDHLPCKPPRMVREEFWVALLAHNAIRTTVLGKAWLCGTRPRELSFFSCC